MSGWMTNKILPVAKYVTFHDESGEEVMMTEIPLLEQGKQLNIIYDVTLVPVRKFTS